MTTLTQPNPTSTTASRTAAPNIAVVGVTGAVGQEFLSVLADRDFPIGELKVLASARSSGRSQPFGDRTLMVEELTKESFEDVDIALFSAGSSVSKHYAPIAVQAGAVVVDNSSAFRMDPNVPLVVPEVNANKIAQAGIAVQDCPGIIANPNCSTIIMMVAAHPLHQAAGLKRVVVSTYQAASGAGAAAMSELETQAREYVAGSQTFTSDIFGQQYIFNLFSHDSSIGPEGYNGEEMKMVNEARKIWDQPDLGITATCVRVPVLRAHAESLNLTFDKPLDETRARQLLSQAPGIEIIDDRDTNRFPTPLAATNRDEVLVGRIRRDLSQPPGQGLDLFICGDQIRKGAALNAVQIAEQLLG